MENLLSDQSKFQKTMIKDDDHLNFLTSQKKRIDKIYKKLVDSNNMSEETRRHLKPVGTRPGIMYGSCKVHKLAKYLVLILETLATNKYTVKDSFKFATEIVEQDFNSFMGSLDIDSLFTNIPLEETIETCTNNLFKNGDIVHGLKKSKFKDLLSLATKESYFFFNNILYKQIDGVAMGSPLGPSLANTFLTHHEQDSLDSSRYRQLYIRRYVDHIFVLFKSSDHLKRFQSYLNSCHVSMSFTIETEQKNKISFLEVNLILEHGEFITSIYRKPTFSGVCTHFDIFLPDTYKIGMIYTLANRCFRICSSWSMFHQQLILLRGIFKKNGHPENFIDRCFKLFLDRIYILKEKVPTVEKKPLRLVLPYLGNISLQTRTKLQESIKGVLNCCKLQVIFKSQNKLCNNFHFKDPVPQILTSGVVYKFQCGWCNESYYGECVRHLAVRSGEHIGISPLTSKTVQPRKDSAVWHHLLNCNYSPTFVDFSVLCHNNQKYLLELKENLLIMRDRPSMNWKVRSAILYLFEWVLAKLFATLYGLLWSVFYLCDVNY